MMQATYLTLLVVAIGGSYLVANRNNFGKTVQQAAIWVLIFIGIVGAYGLWNDISGDVTGRQALLSDDRIEVSRQLDGHYYLTLDVNDTSVRFVVDTGASMMVLSEGDARKVGINTDDLGFFGRANTANGVVSTAPVTLDQVSLGPFTDNNVRAVVNGGELDQSLLGMTYLENFAHIEIANGKLVLTR